MSDEILKHEALDRIDCVNQIIDTLLLKHSYIANNERVLRQVEDAQAILSYVYNQIGRE